MTTQAVVELLDAAWHALAHLDVRQQRRILPKEEVDGYYETACLEGDRVQGLLSDALKQLTKEHV